MADPRTGFTRNSIIAWIKIHIMSYYDDHPCNKTEHHLWKAIFFINTPDCFVMFLFNYLYIYIYIYIYIYFINADQGKSNIQIRPSITENGKENNITKQSGVFMKNIAVHK